MTSPSSVDDKPQYKDTLNLPQTTFPMRAGAATREPELQNFWDKHAIYAKAQQRRENAPPFVLHDGPPYLSSPSIHVGTALNKVLKDIVTRYQNLRGHYTPFVPGYDGHGLPIEAAVEKKIKGGRRAVTPFELRQKCRAFALENMKGQEAHFQRLGVWGDWAHPYLTIDGHFEATQIRLFSQMVQKGYVYKGLKPVYWCPISESAMAEAEIEYADHESHSIYVRFPLVQPLSKRFDAPLSETHTKLLSDASLVIWTTTPWTLPANVAIAVNPKETYTVVRHPQQGKLVVVQALLNATFQAMKQEVPPVEGTLPGSVLRGLLAQHPFIADRQSVVLTADYVTTEAGTGLVHTAPGHGTDDFYAVQALNRQALSDAPLPVLSPVDNRGCFTDEPYVPEAIRGLFYEKANWVLLDLLKDHGALLHNSLFTHSYPHSWRSHAPVIFRATEQWFINIDGFRQTALEAIAGVQWIPARGETRIASMVEGRSEWCVSRQRVWGVPIPAFYCAQCGHMHLSPESTELVAQRFEAETSDAWCQYTADELLQGKIACSACGSTTFTKEEDVMDVWFDSGVTHTAVVEARSDELGHLPVDLYLEGSDQHRGWFQSSLLTSVMLRDAAPYKAVLTHGFVLDEQGRKMSKSLGNVIDPNVVMRELGADVLRLWVASVDYSSDVRLGPNTLKQLADIYRKIRNTARFLLGNLAGFNPLQDRVPLERLSVLDRYVLHRTARVCDQLTQAFDRYEFHRFYQTLQTFCVVELSSLYFDVVKDILYCNRPDDERRRAVQTVLYDVLGVLSRLIIPVMPHLAEDIWQHWPQVQRPTFTPPEPPESILLSDWPVCSPTWQLDDTALHQFEALLSLRETVNVALEVARSNEDIGSALEAGILLQPTNDEFAFLGQLHNDELATLFLTSQVELLKPGEEATLRQYYQVLAEQEHDDNCRVYAVKALGHKCDRCWKSCESVGAYADHPSLCHRCHNAVSTKPAAAAQPQEASS